MDSLSYSDDGGSPAQRKTTSRRKKTHEQIEILERLYAEDKYPSEEVRTRLSAKLGLSEKQMQIWFTHRRHKDRKDGVEDVKLTFYAMRHKGGEAHLDFMEELNNGKRMGGTLLGRDDTLPSSGHQPVPYPTAETNNGQYNVETRTDSDSENSGLGEADDFTSNGFKPSMKRGSFEGQKSGGYKRPMLVPPKTKVDQKDLELAAISAVEAQLGGSIRLDGPHLGMEFDPLPPDAWAQLASSPGAPSVPTSMQGRGRTQSIGIY